MRFSRKFSTFKAVKNSTIYTIHKYSKQYVSQWNDFISQSKNGTFLFNRHFMDYHKDRFEDYSLMVFKDDKLVAVLPANRIEDKLFSHQGLTYGGLVISKKLKLYHFVDVFKALLKFLNNNKISTLNLKLIPSIYTGHPTDELDYLLFLTQAKLYRKDTLSVTVIEDQIKFSKDRLTGYKKGVKHALEVREVNDFEDFWNTILIPNLKHKHDVYPVHSLDEITLLKQQFPDKIRQFNVYKENNIVAGTTIFETKYVAHSQYISGNDEKNQLGSLDFLHHYLIKEIFKSKRYFDFGISNENKGLQLNSGLLYWKEGYGTSTVTQGFYEVSTENFKLLDHVLI